MLLNFNYSFRHINKKMMLTRRKISSINIITTRWSLLNQIYLFAFQCWRKINRHNIKLSILMNKMSKWILPAINLFLISWKLNILTLINDDSSSFFYHFGLLPIENDMFRLADRKSCKHICSEHFQMIMESTIICWPTNYRCLVVIIFGKL